MRDLAECAISREAGLVERRDMAGVNARFIGDAGFGVRRDL